MLDRIMWSHGVEIEVQFPCCQVLNVPVEGLERLSHQLYGLRSTDMGRVCQKMYINRLKEEDTIYGVRWGDAWVTVMSVRGSSGFTRYRLGEDAILIAQT
jgi:hypothetical protein